MKKLFALLLISLFMVQAVGCDKKAPLTCDDGYDNVDKTCVWIKTPFEEKLEKTAELSNYTITVDVLLKEEVSSSLIKFDGDNSSIEYGHVKEYFQQDGDKTYRYYETLEGYKKEAVIKEVFNNYQFYKNLLEADFTLMDGKYLLNYGTYKDIDDFVKSFDSKATYANVTLKITGDYISEIKLDIIKLDLVYKLTLTFSNINQTEVEVPTYEN